jgi:hypothetical protein
MSQWDCIKLESFCREKIFASYSSDKGLISRIYWELKNIAPKESTPQ